MYTCNANCARRLYNANYGISNEGGRRIYYSFSAEIFAHLYEYLKSALRGKKEYVYIHSAVVCLLRGLYRGADYYARIQ